MKKIIMSLIFIASMFSTLVSADTLSIASGSTFQCNAQTRPVKGFTVFTISNTITVSLIGSNQQEIMCSVGGLSDARMNMLISVLSDVKTSGQSVFIGLQSSNLYISAY